MVSVFLYCLTPVTEALQYNINPDGPVVLCLFPLHTSPFTIYIGNDVQCGLVAVATAGVNSIIIRFKDGIEFNEDLI